QLRQPRAELDGVARSSGLPYTLTEILLFMAAATLVHALVSSVRKRRSDLAILKTLGFSRGQVRSAVAWQATTFAVLALAIGLPVGTVLGRWAWGWFVGSIGLVRFTITPPPTVVAIVVVNTLLLANAIAFLPGRSAARTQPAQILRAE
ncbi:MAG: FtsX-like permease family protein, partial [Actinobacteria bacterium]